MKLKLDFSLDDCVIVISEDGDMSLSYCTPAGDFEMTLREEIVTVEWDGIVPTPENIVPQAEKLLAEIMRSQEFHRFYHNSLRKLRWRNGIGFAQKIQYQGSIRAEKGLDRTLYPYACVKRRIYGLSEAGMSKHLG